jgi:hypothetical protein
MKQKQMLYSWIVTVLLLGTAYFSIQSVLVKQKEPIQEHMVAIPEQENELPSLAVFINEQWCFDLWPQADMWFTTQSYRWWHYKDDSIWLMSHFKSAFTQGELGCGSNSLSTSLYWQKNMINRFIQELEEIEKKKWKNPQYDYIKAQAKILQAQAEKKSMGPGQWLDCYGSTSPEAMLCRPLTNIDWLEALFPNMIAEVKARKNTWFEASVIYTDWISNWYEFIDNVINLSLPLSSPQRLRPRWAQNDFKEFVARTFDAYDAQRYLAPKPWTQDPYFNLASTNPILDTWKTMYTTYREWLLNYKKYKPYVSNLEKTRASANNNNNTQPINNNNNTTPKKPIQDNANTILLPSPTKPIGDQTRPITDPRSVIAPAPNKWGWAWGWAWAWAWGWAIIVPLPPKTPEKENKANDTVQSSYTISLPVIVEEPTRAVFDATITQQPNTNTTIPTTPTTRSLRF